MITNNLFNSKTTLVAITEYHTQGKKSPDMILFKFYDLKKKFLGDIAVEQYYAGHYETHSYIKRPYRGKGLGLFMYSTVADWCLSHGIKLYSASIHDQSRFAKRLWASNTLRKKYQVKMATNARWRILPLEGTKPSATGAKLKKPSSLPHLFQHVVCVEKNPEY